MGNALVCFRAIVRVQCHVSLIKPSRFSVLYGINDSNMANEREPKLSGQDTGLLMLLEDAGSNLTNARSLQLCPWARPLILN